MSAKAASAAVSLTILNYPKSIKIDEPFSLTASVSGLSADQEFKYKVGVSTTTTSYSYGQVKNDASQWIGYQAAGSCDNAPSQKADEIGFWNGEIVAKVSRTAKAGDGKLKFKICVPDKTSGIYPVVVTEADPLSTTKEEEEAVEETEETTASEESESSDPTPSTPSTETLRSPGEGGPTTSPKPKTVYQLPATLSAIPVPELLGSTSTAEATAEAEATASSKTLSTTYFGQYGVIFAIIAGVGFIIGLVAVPKFLKTR